MKYYYLTAEGTTAGPETLDSLYAMVENGTVHAGTLVVPAGGEDWTPLARVLRFFYTDAAGNSAGPVVFSELDRLHQVGALDAQSWVVEEKCSGWKALADVLTAAGAAVRAPAAAAPRTVTSPYRPPAADLAQGRRTVVRNRAPVGIGRLAFIGLGLLTGIVAAVIVMLLMMQMTSLTDAGYDEVLRAVQRYYAAVGVMGILIVVTQVFLGVQRTRNIGWPWPLGIIPLLPTILNVVAVVWLIRSDAVAPWTWFPLVSGILHLIGFCYVCCLLVLPPGFSRHRRLDTAAKVIVSVVGLLVAGFVALAVMKPDWLRRRSESKPVPSAEP